MKLVELLRRIQVSNSCDGYVIVEKRWTIEFKQEVEGRDASKNENSVDAHLRF